MNKTLLLCLVLFSFLANSAHAQSDIYLKINHLIGTEIFAFEKNTQSVDGELVKFRRMEYYVSQIRLVHDGGKIIPVNYTWLLIDASKGTNVLLGNYAITDLEEIRFSIGIEFTMNHKDPSTYDPSHPLALKTPSMHWGWQAGYRFVALEGSSGPMRDNNLEIHALGDGDYKQTKIATSGTLNGSDLTIELNADYEESLAGIEIKDGLIIHAENFQGEDLMTNFQTRVFTSIEGNTSALSVQTPNALNARLYPNPSGLETTLHLENVSEVQSIVIYNQLGQEVLNLSHPNEFNTLQADFPGIYFIRAIGKDETYSLIKWVVNQ